MSLKHILLGILQEPKSGYDVKKIFDQVFSNFWAAELSQIYPQLKKLAAQNLLTVSEVESEKGPNKKIYQTTDSGKQELVLWLTKGPVTNTEKLAYLAQTFFLDALENNQQRLKFLEDLLEHMKIWHNTLVTIQNDMKQEFTDYPHGLPDEEFYPNLTLMLGVKKVGANVEWVEESIVLLRERMH
ncbi:MAG: PadR family transcriptional regulator [Marinicellaceae bacterium]